MRQLSLSFGLSEAFMGGPKGEVAVQHQKFLLLAAAGVNVFCSSGDPARALMILGKALRVP